MAIDTRGEKRIMYYQRRITGLQQRLRRRRLDGIIIARPENRRYLSGYKGGDHGIEESSGLLIVPAKGAAHLVTDFRFELQAQQETKDIMVHVHRGGVIQLLGQLLPDLSIKRFGFESDYTLYFFAEKLKKELRPKGISPVPVQGLVEQMRIVKDEQEIALIKKSVQLNEAVFSSVFNELGAYRTERELAAAIESAMVRQGAEKPSFSTIVASGRNGALPHAVPGTDRIEQNGSLTIDMGLILNGYCSDMTRNFVPQEPDSTYRKLHRIVRKAQLAGIAAVKAGARCCDIDRAARAVIKDAGYGNYFGHSLGHGVGLAVHEEPRVSAKSRRKLKAGMVITIEPGIYIPDWGGIRLENMVVVTSDGCENLNEDTTMLDI
ncbi:M24 family metallopeptidase [Desulforhopalus singaporensis]|uniref:Xaa-Pro aminopeptidase n=1 Tax=Desulforhopalus singaporensis TaxID=91360 RepID=A0A1H0LE55_9BACT|nr:aminopeptidase P family protein [Desulforhopalus singaporensis]SDO66488.1 Xaa-Pro aminopeptidase [Desulforhopalus singaporensis]